MAKPEVPPFRVNFKLGAGSALVQVATRPGSTKRFLAPKEFTAEGAAADVGVTMTVEIDSDGFPHCTELRLHQLDGGEPITGATLRRLPVGALVREALSAVTGEIVRALPGGGVQANLFTTSLRNLEHDAAPRRRTAITDEHLREVAERYRAALERGEPPTEAVGAEMHAARSTAARWVSQARQRGFLAPAIPGRAGEQSKED